MIKEKLRLLIGREQPPSQNALSQYDFRQRNQQGSVFGSEVVTIPYNISYVHWVLLVVANLDMIGAPGDHSVTPSGVIPPDSGLSALERAKPPLFFAPVPLSSRRARSPRSSRDTAR